MSVISLVVQWFADPAHWSGPDGIPQRLVEHLQISAESVAIGAVIALPIGIALGHYGRFGNVAINISNVGRALPSFGVLVIAFQVLGLGNLPILVALVALAIPPMVTNSYVGLQEVDPDVKEAARGMGYRELAQLLRGWRWPPSSHFRLWNGCLSLVGSGSSGRPSAGARQLSRPHKWKNQARPAV